jgi:hypothetical protein
MSCGTRNTLTGIRVHNGATVSSDTIAKLFKYLGVEDVRPFIVRSGRNRSNGG